MKARESVRYNQTLLPETDTDLTARQFKTGTVAPTYSHYSNDRSFKVKMKNSPIDPSGSPAWNEGLTGPFADQEHDACAVIAVLSRNGIATHATVQQALSGLQMMEHRAGQIRNEGDGCGIQMDIPRTLWQRWLSKEDRDPELARDPRFVVAHVYTPHGPEGAIRETLVRQFEKNGFDVL